MENNHPIQPSCELVEDCAHMLLTGAPMRVICEAAAQWGADQELEECDAMVARLGEMSTGFLTSLRRESTPPSLKEQAMEAIDDIERRTEHLPYMGERIETIRTALDELND